MMSLSDVKQADIIEAFNTSSRYLDDILNFNNVNFDNMVSQLFSWIICVIYVLRLCLDPRLN